MSATLALPLPLRVPAPATLEALISGAWEGVAAAAETDCPVCGGHMQPRWSAGAGVVGGRCADCGSTLE